MQMVGLVVQLVGKYQEVKMVVVVTITTITTKTQQRMELL